MPNEPNFCADVCIAQTEYIIDVPTKSSGFSGLDKLSNEAIYEREVVKRGGADFVERGSRTSPSPSASVDLAQLEPGHGRSVRATRYTSSESEAEGDCSSSIPAMFECGPT